MSLRFNCKLAFPSLFINPCIISVHSSFFHCTQWKNYWERSLKKNKYVEKTDTK